MTGEIYLDVDVTELRRLATDVRARGAGLHDAGLELAGLSSIAATPTVVPGRTVGASAGLLAATRTAERAHRSLLAAARARTDEIATAMVHAADAYARHETHQAHVLLEAVRGG